MKRIAVALALCLSFAACPASCPSPKPGQPGAIDCTVQAVKDHALGLVGPVNRCLVQAFQGEVTDCLISLISPAAGITQEVLACIVRSAGSSFAANANVNPNDQVSSRAAENARVFLSGKTFAN